MAAAIAGIFRFFFFRLFSVFILTTSRTKLFSKSFGIIPLFYKLNFAGRALFLEDSKHTFRFLMIFLISIGRRNHPVVAEVERPAVPHPLRIRPATVPMRTGREQVPVFSDILAH